MKNRPMGQLRKVLLLSVGLATLANCKKNSSASADCPGATAAVATLKIGQWRVETIGKLCSSQQWDATITDCFKTLREKADIPGCLSTLSEKKMRAFTAALSGGEKASTDAQLTTIKNVDAGAYVSPAGRYKVITLGQPDSEKEMADPNGGTWISTSWKTMGGGLHLVQFRDYDSHAAAVAETRGFVPTRDLASVKSDKAAKFGERDGREIEMTVGDKTLWTRFIIDDKRVYKLGSANQGDRQAAVEFFDKFQITAPTAAPPM